MPIYEYQCQSCQHQLEALQKISEDKLRDCPACGEPALNKKVSAAAFRLKGSGWYETDFKTGDKKNLAGDSAKSTSEASTDAGSSSGSTSGSASGSTSGSTSESSSGSTAGSSSGDSKAAS
jgi:putative FmdB family regulatory protein